MAEFHANIQPFDLDAVHAVDSQECCITITVGCDEHDMPVTSLRHLSRELDIYVLPDRERVKSATKLYVVGQWNYSFNVEQVVEVAQNEASDPWAAIADHERLTRMANLS